MVLVGHVIGFVFRLERESLEARRFMVNREIDLLFGVAVARLAEVLISARAGTEPLSRRATNVALLSPENLIHPFDNGSVQHRRFLLDSPASSPGSPPTTASFDLRATAVDSS